MKSVVFALLVAGGMVIEGLFLRAVFGGAGGVGMVSLHALGSVLGGLGLLGLVTRIAPARGGRRWLAVFLVGGALCLPLLGLIGPLFAVLGNAWLPRRGDLPDSIVPVPHRELPERGEQAPSSPRLGAASAYGRLRHARTILDRMDALIALRGIEDKSTIPVLKLALRDNADEVRLLAFTMLQERERAYYAEIHARKGKLAAANLEDAITHRTAIAQAYWELAYQDLVQGELLAFSLEEAGTQLAMALSARPKDPGNTMLLGRIRLRQGRYPEAARLLDEARALGLPDAVVRPHQAEVAFLARDFGKTRAYLADLPPQARQLAVIGDLAEFWA